MSSGSVLYGYALDSVQVQTDKWESYFQDLLLTWQPLCSSVNVALESVFRLEAAKDCSSPPMPMSIHSHSRANAHASSASPASGLETCGKEDDQVALRGLQQRRQGS